MKILDFAKHNKLWLSISITTTLVSLALIAVFGLNLGNDFIGGTVIDYKFNDVPIDKVKIEKTVESEGIDVYRIVVSEGDRVTIYTETITEEQAQKLDDSMKEEFGDNIERIGIETVGPSIGKETLKKALFSVIFVSLTIILYLAFAFRSVPKPTSSIEFGVSVIIAMLHDVVVVLGAFALLGRFFNAEINSLFITAILTVIGFSIHDSIVVFDRIRENLQRRKGADFPTVVNNSLLETLARSVNLSLTVLVTLLSLFVLGSESIRWFVGALIIGMVSGTYSSIFVATQVLLFIENIKARRR